MGRRWRLWEQKEAECPEVGVGRGSGHNKEASGPRPHHTDPGHREKSLGGSPTFHSLRKARLFQLVLEWASERVTCKQGVTATDVFIV